MLLCLRAQLPLLLGRGREGTRAMQELLQYCQDKPGAQHAPGESSAPEGGSLVPQYPNGWRPSALPHICFSHTQLVRCLAVRGQCYRAGAQTVQDMHHDTAETTVLQSHSETDWQLLAGHQVMWSPCRNGVWC